MGTQEKNKAVKRVGITGQSGFIGFFLKSYIQHVDAGGLEIVDFQNNFFLDEEKLQKFVSQCDSIVHLAGMMRGDEEEIYKTNLMLTEKLIGALKKTHSKAQVIFSSSIHEKMQNSFGRAKKESRALLNEWAKSNNSKFAGLIIPHVFGPFAKPFHNSGLATFCYQLANQTSPKLINDSELKLIYVEDLVRKIIELIKSGKGAEKVKIMPQKLIMVSDLLKKLNFYNNLYLKKNIIPRLEGEFENNLFNTFSSYVELKDKKILPGECLEDYLENSVQIKGRRSDSYLLAKNMENEDGHFHTRTIERIHVVKGRARIEVKKVGDTKSSIFQLSGNRPAVLDIPVWHSRKIKNLSSGPLSVETYYSQTYGLGPDAYYEDK